MGKLIEFNDVTYTYNKGTPLEKRALDHVSFSVDEGEFLAIIGHTGSGKSTLIQHLNGLLKPDEGKIIIDGQDTTGKGLKQLRKKVGIVFQYPEHQLFEETVYKDIEFGLIKHNIQEPERKQRILETARIMELSEELLEKSPYELSGGQKRRAAIAGILVLKPNILVLDEPIAGLDPRGCRELFNIVSNLYSQKNMTVILVSHSMEIVADYARRIIVMDDGKMIIDGRVDEVFLQDDLLSKNGLSIPQITKLMKKLHGSNEDISGEIFTVDQAYDEIIRYLEAKND